SRRRHTRFSRDWSSDVCSSDLFADKSFTFIMKTPPATVLIKKAAGIKSGSARPHLDKVATLTRAQVEEIAKTKEPDLTAADMDRSEERRVGKERKARTQSQQHN